jgi:hypothetical protein
MRYGRVQRVSDIVVGMQMNVPVDQQRATPALRSSTRRSRIS